MKKTYYLISILVLFTFTRLFADYTYFNYSVTADNNLYQVGDEVNWEVHAYIEGESRGIRSFDVNLYESRNEFMEAPETARVGAGSFGFVDNFIPLNSSYFHFQNFFEVTGSGDGGIGGVFGLGVRQYIDQTSPAFLKALDKTGGKLCDGSYTVARTGFHTLAPLHNYGSIWIDENGNYDDIDVSSRTPFGFYVTETENPDLGDTDISVLNVISESYDDIGCDESNDFCDEADVNMDGEVNDLDVSDLFYEGGSNITVEDDSFVYQDIIAAEEEEAEDELMLKSYHTLGAPASGSVSFSALTNNAANFSNLGRKILFSANDGVNGDELWTVAGNVINSYDLNEGEFSSSPRLLTKHAKSVYFLAKDTDNNWFLYEFNRDLTEPVKITENPLYTGETTEFLSLASFAGTLYYTVVARDNRQLWRLDGPTKTPTRIAEIGEPVVAPHHLTAAGEYLYFVVYDHLSGYSLQRSDGENTESIRAFGWNRPGSLTAAGENLFFATQDGLWTSNGTTEGTVQVATIKVEADPMRPLCVWNGAVYFAAYDPDTGIELWTSNGTAEGTHIVKDITPGPESSLIPNLQALPNGVLFSTTTAPDQACLWHTDGTEQGTTCLADFSTGDASPMRLHQFRRFMGRNLYFLANDRLFRYQGVTCELAELTDANGNPPPADILYITPASDKLVIITDKDPAGRGLWLYGSEY